MPTQFSNQQNISMIKGNVDKRDQLRMFREYNLSPYQYSYPCSLQWRHTMTSQITSLTIVYPTVCSGADQRKHQRASNAENVSIWWRHHVPSVLGCDKVPVSCAHCFYCKIISLAWEKWHYCSAVGKATIKTLGKHITKFCYVDKLRLLWKQTNNNTEYKSTL